MSGRARRAVLAGLCWIATACATSPATYFARMDEKGRSLISQQQWEEALGVSQTALSRCDRTDWCSKDPRYQGLFHSTIGEAQEHLGRRDLAMQHYRAAFYAYPLYFTENYFRLLRESGMLRQLRREIDVKLANNEKDYRSAAAFWLPSSSRPPAAADWSREATVGVCARPKAAAAPTSQEESSCRRRVAPSPLISLPRRNRPPEHLCGCEQTSNRPPRSSCTTCLAPPPTRDSSFSKRTVSP